VLTPEGPQMAENFLSGSWPAGPPAGRSPAPGLPRVEPET
jgi:hypothetical protein